MPDTVLSIRNATQTYPGGKDLEFESEKQKIYSVKMLLYSKRAVLFEFTAWASN